MVFRRVIPVADIGPMRVHPAGYAKCGSRRAEVITVGVVTRNDHERRGYPRFATTTGEYESSLNYRD